MILFRYRFTLKCFSVIDAVSSVFNAISPILKLSNDDGSRNQHRFGTVTGDDGVMADDRFALLGLVFLIGPVCGYIGASRFNRSLVTIYLAFCVGKTAFEIAIAIFTLFLWYILIALVQIWVTKIVFTFWRALGAITKERCLQLADPAYVPDVPTRIAYW